MVPMQLLVLKDKVGDDSEDHQRDALLDHLELDKVKGTAVIDKTDAICGNLATVLEEGDHPREGDDEVEGPVVRDARLLQTQVTIPGECHENIAHDEQQNRINTICHGIGNFKNGAKLLIFSDRRTKETKKICYYVLMSKKMTIFATERNPKDFKYDE